MLTFSTNPIIRHLCEFPQIQKIFLGAVESLKSNKHEAYRHCIISCRASIEALCINIGGDKDWKKALNNIFSSKTDRKSVKDTWSYLSNKGAHGGHYPSRKEAEYGLNITTATEMCGLLDV